jgi:hypothetical protein
MASTRKLGSMRAQRVDCSARRSGRTLAHARLTTRLGIPADAMRSATQRTAVYETCICAACVRTCVRTCVQV